MYWSHFQFQASLRTRWIQQSFGSLHLHERIIDDGNGESQEKKIRETVRNSVCIGGLEGKESRPGSPGAFLRGRWVSEGFFPLISARSHSNARIAMSGGILLAT